MRGLWFRQQAMRSSRSFAFRISGSKFARFAVALKENHQVPVLLVCGELWRMEKAQMEMLTMEFFVNGFNRRNEFPASRKERIYEQPG